MNNVKDWINEWCLLYPEDAKWNDTKLRSDVKYCVNKMQKFCKEHPAYTKDTIFAATKLYLQEKAKVNYEYARQSTYFINKQGYPSLLEEYCEKITKGQTEPKTILQYDYNIIDDFI